MGPVNSPATFNQGPKKRTIEDAFNHICNEFKRDAVNGSITLHFSQGAIAKIHSLRVE